MTMKRQLKLVGNDDTDATTIKVAVATTDRKCVNQHFGAAESFAIYRVSPSGYELLEVAQFGRLDMDGNEDKLGAKIEALEGCIAVYCQAIGASAIAKLRAQGIQPIKVAPDTLVSSLLHALKRELRDGPSAWLKRAIEQQSPRSESRFDAMAAEAWEE
ncbi:NifB/NifX family molybdenum-iron cluster-binding protein [Halochromatium salexigens]|uniref:Nitrogen fixation protein NifX n=1 Tax=Halochromatium salexigens TaxID=49447 RepID=A0AAJ0XH56_HALSE|nr:NifB/NifX family molybdenum-iron cluster-binding protein [Halochromatium salexigens]MBK5931365.1 nitrogen fixation protein NifX [Halochromatium salexigens]